MKTYDDQKVKLFSHNFLTRHFGFTSWPFKPACHFFDNRAKRWSRREYPCYRPHPAAAISVKLLPCEWTCTADGRPITAGQRRRSRDFPLNVQHPLHHDSDTHRGFSWVRLTLRDFTFPPSFITFKHFQKSVGLSCSQRILLRILLTGLIVSSLLCKLKYFLSNSSFNTLIQSGFGGCSISFWTKSFCSKKWKNKSDQKFWYKVV